MITKTKMSFNAKVFNEDRYPEDFCPPFYHGTTSCAVGFTSFKNYHSLEEIKDFLAHIRKDSNSKIFSAKERNFGERTLLTIVVSPAENTLEKNLIDAGFSLIKDNLGRRRGYPADQKLKMYLYSF